MTKLIAFEELLNLIDEDPISGAQEAQKRNKGVRIMNYQSSVSAGALYRRLKGSRSLLSGFYGLPFFASNEYRNYIKNPKYLNKHCHQFVYGAREGSEGKRAEDHAYAIQSILDDDTKSLEDIYEVLKVNGFSGLKKANPKLVSDKEVRQRPKEMQAPERKWGKAEGGTTEASGGAGGSPLIRTAVNEAGGPPATPPLPKITMKKVFEHLLVAMDEDQLPLFLAANSKVGDRYGIMVEREADDVNGMLVWQAVEVAKADTE